MTLLERSPTVENAVPHRAPTEPRARWRKKAATPSVLAAAILSAACTSTVESERPSGPCADRSGSYVVRITQRSGTCANDGDTTEAIVNFDATTQQALESSCTGESTPSEDNCSIQFTIKCARDDLGPGWTTHETGKSTWNEDGSEGAGTAQLTLFRGNGIQECRSTVNITWVRQ